MLDFIEGKGLRIKFYDLLERVFFRYIHLKKTFILHDRLWEAGDNAEALFRYLQENHRKEGKFYFLLRKNSPDYFRLSTIGKVIEPMSLKHWFLHCCCTGIITSNPENFFFNYKKQKRIFFLQHGVLLNNVARVYNAKRWPLSLFVTSTKMEYESLLDSSYGYGNEVIKLTGLPRWDYRENNPQKVITFHFTWRAYLSNKNLSDDMIKETSYYKMFFELLCKPDFFNLAELYGYKIQVKLHPKIKEMGMRLLKQKDQRLTVLHEDYTYSQLFSESSLLITDYSSTSFDMAYLGKPVLYFQEDVEEFYSGKHSLDKGYFDYERDGLGEVVNSRAALYNSVEKLLKNDCEMPEKYRLRVQKTFAFRDKNNCNRIWNAIENVEKNSLVRMND